MDDLRQGFVIEAREHLDEAERDLVALERNPADATALARVFRALHTIKGNSGFLSLTRLERLAHAAETVLGRCRDGALVLDAHGADVLLKVVDSIRALLARVERSGTDEGHEIELLVDELAGLEAAPAAPVPARAPAPSRAPAAAPTVRIDVGLLDRFMELVGELVLARNRAQAAPGASFPLELQRITTGLQEAVAAARLEPVGRLWNRFPRIVRDTASRLAKRVRFTMTGDRTELDRSVLEAIADPLVHLLRNSIDHGIEPPAERLAAGKPPEGEVRLAARQEGSAVVIELRDDGRGLDVERIRARARELGLAVDAAPVRDVLQCVFEPGFSTARTVTDLSGRGVGLDVVKSGVEGLGGSVEIATDRGAGTSIHLRLPLTVAIVPGVVLRAGGQRFILPQERLRELVSADCAMDGGTVFLRDRTLPAVDLAGMLGLSRGDGSLVAIVEAHERAYGLIVDGVDDTHDIVVKPLGPPLDALSVYAGATILGDGSAALILDVDGVADRAGVARGSAPEPAAVPSWSFDIEESFLVFEPGSGDRCAVPVAAVERIAEFDRDAVQEVGGRPVLYHGGQVLPLARVGEEPLPARLQVAIHARKGRRIGLLVNTVVDVVRFAPEPDPTDREDGSLGDQVVAGRRTRLLDLTYYVRWASGWASG